VEHRAELDELFTQVLGLMSAEGLITLEQVVQDGTKIKAQAASDSFQGEAKIAGNGFFTASPFERWERTSQVAAGLPPVTDKLR
jgi:hypothetical protein